MASRMAGRDLLSQLDILMQVGVVGGLSDGQLLQRFLADGDRGAEAAFTALVHRHGPMVLRVCRQVLGETADAEDAFQSAFLILASKAASVRKADSLASWLHGVARRVAVRARTDAARRRVYELRCAAMKSERIEGPEAGPDDWADLHEEIARLPGRYREPIVLCYFEGLTSEQVADRLGCAQGTILSRLCRARDLLRRQLARRGRVSAALPDGMMPAGPGIAALPSGLIEATVRASFAFVGRHAADAAWVSSRVVALARKGICAMMISKSKSVAALALVCAGVFGWMQTRARSSDGGQPGSTTQTAPSRPKDSGAAGSSEFPFAVKFEQGATQFLDGDRITIEEVRGTAETMKPGHIYWIRGTYTLASHDRATLAAYTTARTAAEGTSTTFLAQTTVVERGSGTFTLFLPMSVSGWPHVSFYPADGGESFGGNYFGTGDSVLKEWWGTKPSRETPAPVSDLEKTTKFPHVVKFEQGATRFLDGDRIRIEEVRGTAETIVPGQVYRIRGTYTLASHDRARLDAYVTGTGAAGGSSRTLKAQMSVVERGSGTFTLTLPMTSSGWPHVSFYPADGGESFGGNYFGTGGSVLKEWWGSRKAH